MTAAADRLKRSTRLSTYSDKEEMVDAINKLGQGGGENWRLVTLAADPATTTTIQALGMGAGAGVSFTPQDAAARAMNVVLDSVSEGEIVLGHDAAVSPGVVLVEWRQ